MGGERFEQEVARETVTHEEAVRMVELWTHSDCLGKGSVELRDVTEALGISDAEGARLLAQARGERREPRRPFPELACYVLASLLVATLAACALFLYEEGAAILRGSSLSGNDWLWILAALLWTTAWPFYYRRAIARALSRLARGFGGFVHGKG